MKKKALTLEEKRLDNDLWIIAVVTFVAFSVYILFGNQMMNFIKDHNKFILWRILLNSTIQFAIAGLGVTVVCMFRKEHFKLFGLTKKGAVQSILGAILSFLPYVAYVFISGQYKGYEPFSIMLTNDILSSKFPMNIIGMALIIVVWGFFEGFNYVVISDKLNKRYKTPRKWLNVGAITCALICILVHPLGTSFWGMVEIITTFIAIYGMLMTKEKTGNAWGCIFVFCFVWNAF